MIGAGIQCSRAMRRERYLDFDGSSERLGDDRNQGHGFTSAFSVLFTVRPDTNLFVFTGSLFEIRPSGGSANRVTVQGGTVGTDARISVTCHAAGGAQRIEIIYIVSVTPEPHQYVFTKSGSSGILYQDGVQVATDSGAASSYTDSNRRLAIGSGVATSGSYFQGPLGPLACWNEALSATSIRALWAHRHNLNLRAPFGGYTAANAGNCIYWWRDEFTTNEGTNGSSNADIRRDDTNVDSSDLVVGYLV